MKTDSLFIALPFAVTAVNFWVALVLHAHHAHHAEAQPVMLQQPDALTGATLGVKAHQYASLDRFILESNGDIVVEHEDAFTEPADFEEGDDPMLKDLPGYPGDKAYVRADIATFYGQEPGSLTEQTPEFNGQAGKFINMSPETVSLWWVGPRGPVLNSHVGPWGSGGTACYPTNKFIFTEKGEPSKVLCTFTVTKGKSVYYCDPFEPDILQSGPDPSRGTRELTRSLSDLSKQDVEYYQAHRFNLEFGQNYKNFTGSEWLAMYPAETPKHKMWRADHFGQTHTVATSETQFEKLPPPENFSSKRLSVGEMRRGEGELGVKPFASYRAPGTMNITIKALSCTPRAFEIRDFLSPVEVDHLLDLVQKKNLIRSTTGYTDGQVSDTRTSSTTWLQRNSDPILNVIFRRVADVLRMDEALFRNREAGEVPNVDSLTKINEDLQIVHYDEGQQYTAHHDFGYPKGPGAKHEVRSINLCMYLNDVPAGGQTSFPRWRNAETRKSLDVKPEKGKAMIFYMVNPDGNLEDLSQHAALPVVEGEKFFANLWIRSY